MGQRAREINVQATGHSTVKCPVNVVQVESQWECEKTGPLKYSYISVVKKEWANAVVKEYDKSHEYPLLEPRDGSGVFDQKRSEHLVCGSKTRFYAIVLTIMLIYLHKPNIYIQCFT